MADLRRMEITACEYGTSGTGQYGDWTLYNVKAKDDQGNAIPRKLNSFAELPLGWGEFEVTKRTKSRDDGTTEDVFTLKLPKGSQAPTSSPAQAPSGGVTTEMLNSLRRDVEQLAVRLGTVEHLLAGRANQPDITQPSVQERASGQPAPRDWGDDIPF